MGDQFYNIPVSFRFDPTDEELIGAYLFPKVTGSPLPWDGIVTKELYGDNASPWEVFSDIDGENSLSLHCNTKRESGKTKKTVYVFTKVTKAAPNSKKRISRRAGCGTWSGQTGAKDIVDSTTGDIIGSKKMLSFQYPKENVGDFGHWIMHEYSLTDRWKSDVVLCRITRCTDNSTHIPATNNKRPARDDLQQGGRKKHTTADRSLTVDNNVQRLIMDSDANVEVEAGCTLTVEEVERILMEDDDNHEVEGCTLTVEEVERILMEDDVDHEVEGCTLTAEDIEKTLMVMEDINYEKSKSNCEVEGCTVAGKSAAAPPNSSTTSTTTTGDENGNSTLSYRLDDDIGKVFSNVDLEMEMESVDEFFC